MTTRRVVVTGMGAITPLGNTLGASWSSLVDGSSGITSLREALERQDLPQELLDREMKLTEKLPSQVAAPVAETVPHDTRTGRFVQLASIAGAEAVRQSKLDTSWLSKQATTDMSHFHERHYRAGVSVGSGMSSVREIVAAARTMETRGIRKLSPHFVPKVLSNSAAGRLSLDHGLLGPNHSVSTACAAGAHSIGEAMRCIQYNDADIMLAGGTEACIDPLSMAGFCRLRALSTAFNDDPMVSSRPFDSNRDGFVMGEGAAMLVLEELEHAKRRGVPILAELCGYGMSGDGYHITAPDPNGRGAERAMQMALHHADLKPSLIDYVNAHATSTPKGDEIESRTIDRTLLSNNAGDGRCHALYVNSTKGATGHLLGAAGAIEAAFTVMSLIHGCIAHTRNLENVRDEEAQVKFQHVVQEPVFVPLEVAMTNSFGFGGTNASLIFRKYHHSES